MPETRQTRQRMATDPSKLRLLIPPLLIELTTCRAKSATPAVWRTLLLPNTVLALINLDDENQGEGQEKTKCVTSALLKAPPDCSLSRTARRRFTRRRKGGKRYRQPATTPTPRCVPC